MRYSLRNTPKRRASPRPWFADFFLEITPIAAHIDLPDQSAAPALRFNDLYSGVDAQNLFRRKACQPSGENAKRLTSPFALVNSRNAAPACTCPSAPSSHATAVRLVCQLHHYRPLPREACPKVRQRLDVNAKEEEYA